MNTIQKNAYQYIKDEVNINEQIDFFDEWHEEQIEIFQNNFAIVISLDATANIGVEVGGEDDEMLPVLNDKHITVKKIELYKSDTNDEEIEVDKQFIDKIETLLNGQLYD